MMDCNDIAHPLDDTDPIFCAIEAHRGAMEALDGLEAGHADWTKLDQAEKAAWKHFAQSMPRSKDGLLAYVSYAAAYPGLNEADLGAPFEVLRTIEKSLQALLS